MLNVMADNGKLKKFEARRGVHMVVPIFREEDLLNLQSSSELQDHLPDLGVTRVELPAITIKRLSGVVRFVAPLPTTQQSKRLTHLNALRQRAHPLGLAEMLEVGCDPKALLSVLPAYESELHLAKLLSESEFLLVLAADTFSVASVGVDYWPSCLGAPCG